MRIALALLLLFFEAGCASAERTLIAGRGGPYLPGAPLAARDGAEALALVAGQDLYALDLEEESIAHLLREAAPAQVTDLAFAAPDLLYVLLPNDLAVYFGAKLFSICHFYSTPRARLAASPERVYIADGPSLLFFDPAANDLRDALHLEEGEITAVATAPGGCYFSSGDSVYRFRFAEQGGADLIFVLAIPGEKIVSIAADPEAGLLFAATEDATFVYRGGRTQPFVLSGGRLALAGGTLFVSSAKEERLFAIERAASRAAGLAE
jgi:hypothetical protein